MSAEPFVPEFHSPEPEPDARPMRAAAHHHGDGWECANCGRSCEEDYCARCGQKLLHDGDLSLAHAWHHLVHEILHLDGRILTTLKLLFLRPGQLSLDFLEGRRARHVHPVRVFLVFSAVFFLVSFKPTKAAPDAATAVATAEVPRLLFLPGRLGELKPPSPFEKVIRAKAARERTTFEVAVVKANEQVMALVKYGVTTIVVVNGLWLAHIFRRRRRYIAEHLVVVLHVACVTMTAVAATILVGGRIPYGGTLLATGALAHFILTLRRVYSATAREMVSAFLISVLTMVVTYVGGLFVLAFLVRG